MQKRQAAQLIDHLTKANRELDSALHIAEQLSDEKPRAALSRTLKVLISDVRASAIAPVLQLHSDLESELEDSQLNELARILSIMKKNNH